MSSENTELISNLLERLQKKKSADSQLIICRSEIKFECNVIQIVVIKFDWFCCSELVRIVNEIN